jgi:hypothetical protein
MATYRDEIETLEAKAASLNERIASVNDEIARTDRALTAKLTRAPQGPAVWASCLVAIVGLLVVLGSVVVYYSIARLR